MINIEDLFQIIQRLRVECPWDRVQTLESLRIHTIEEVYELSQTIVEEDQVNLKKELGDLLVHILLYSTIAQEDGVFHFQDVIDSAKEKLIFRHPHIYGDTLAEDIKQVRQNWEKQKLKEGNLSILSGVPKGLPAMVKAYRMQDKITASGLDQNMLENEFDAFKNIIKEIHKLQEIAILEQKTEVLGDVFFELIHWARLQKIDPEYALEKSNQKFKNKFQEMETLLNP